MRGILDPGTFLVGSVATEAAMRDLHGPSILHVATHGFFLADTPRAHAPKDSRGLVLDAVLARPFTLPESPLLRSGLAFAGANGQRPPPDDGILTALEATSLDLWGTRLVTLSACETGVGEVTGREGVQGLRRALLLAGSQSQLTTLWQVDDDATVTLMRGFYTRLKHGATRADALREAQLEVAQVPATSHPYYWAAFVLSGDPRSFEGKSASGASVGPVSPSARGCGCETVGADSGPSDTSTSAWLAVCAAGVVGLRTRRKLRNGKERP